LFGKVVDGDESARQAKEWQEVFSHNGKLNKEKCSFRRVLQHLYIEEYFAVVDLPCGTWGCPTCGPALKGKWEDRMSIPMRASKHIEYVVITTSEWKAYQKKLERKKFPYVRVEDEEGRTHLLLGGEMEGTIIENPSDRLQKLRGLLKQMPFERTAISASKEWVKAAKMAQPKKEKEWKVLGNTKDSLPIIDTRVTRIEGAERSAEFSIPYEGTFPRRGVLYWAPYKTEERYREIVGSLGLPDKSIEKAVREDNKLKTLRVAS
jgi:hypothetical protein